MFLFLRESVEDPAIVSLVVFPAADADIDAFAYPVDCQRAFFPAVALEFDAFCECAFHSVNLESDKCLLCHCLGNNQGNVGAIVIIWKYVLFFSCSSQAPVLEVEDCTASQSIESYALEVLDRKSTRLNSSHS